MRKATKIDLAEADRRALIAIVTDRNSPQKHVWRAQIVRLGRGVILRPAKASTSPPARRCGFVREKRPKTN
jgi:hypothetical protein